MTQHILKIHGVNEVRLDSKEPPKPGEKDVVIDVKACGICGSDLSYIKVGGIPTPGTITALGHEAAGEISFVGSAVEGLIVGQRVAVNPMNTPSNIGSGGPEGAFSEQLLVAEARAHDNILPIADDVSFEVAAMTEPLSVALHGVNRGQVTADDKVVVFGCGPIGLGMVLWLIDRGCTDVIALDLAEERLERARALGAKTINPATEDFAARVKDIHGSHMYFGRERANTDVFIDAAGAPRVLSDVISVAKKHCRHVITAAYMKPIEVPLGAALTSEMNITFAVGYPDEMPTVVAALPRLHDKIASLISHRFSLQDVVGALDIAAQPTSAKVMIEIGG